MFKKISLIFLTLVSIIVSQLCVYADSTKKQATLNAYPCKLYYNNEQIDNAYIYNNSCYVPMRALSNEMGYTVDYQPYDAGEYYSPWRVYGIYTISNRTDTVVINGTDVLYRVFKNDENVSYKAQVTLINKLSIDQHIKELSQRPDANDYDLTNYLKEDTTYISIRSIIELLGGKAEYDKSSGIVNVYGD